MAKLGKGYRDNRPIGPCVGRCDECDGDVVAIQMTTNTKGATATSEKVCNKCGLLHNQSFQLLSKHEYEYKSNMHQYTRAKIEETPAHNRHAIEDNIYPYENFKEKIPYKKLKGQIETYPEYTVTGYKYYYKDHETWLKYNTPQPVKDEGIDLEAEYMYQIIGERPGPKSYRKRNNRENRSTQRLYQAMGRGGSSGAMIKQDKQNWRKTRYKLDAGDYAHELGLSKHQLDQVCDIIDHHDAGIFKMHYKAEDIIFCICLYIGSKTWPFHMVEHNLRKISYEHKRIRKLYSLVRDKLSS